MKLVTKKTAARAPKTVKPTLTLKADRVEVKAEETIAIAVGFKGLDSVEIGLTPAKGFTADLKALGKPGTVRLRAKKDGTTTLVAIGKAGGAEVIRKQIHIRCEGPVVRIVAFGYIPGK